MTYPDNHPFVSKTIKIEIIILLIQALYFCFYFIRKHYQEKAVQKAALDDKKEREKSEFLEKQENLEKKSRSTSKSSARISKTSEQLCIYASAGTLPADDADDLVDSSEEKRRSKVSDENPMPRISSFSMQQSRENQKRLSNMRAFAQSCESYTSRKSISAGNLPELTRFSEGLATGNCIQKCTAFNGYSKTKNVKLMRTKRRNHGSGFVAKGKYAMNDFLCDNPRLDRNRINSMKTDQFMGYKMR